LTAETLLTPERPGFPALIDWLMPRIDANFAVDQPDGWGEADPCEEYGGSSTRPFQHDEITGIKE